MHTVPHGYLQAFAVPDTKRRMPAVWRFDRISGEGKLVGVRDAEVVRDIYTIFGDDGAPDTVIEDDILCDVEGAFCATRDVLRDRNPPTREHWANLARFIALQLLRTPRMLQLVREEIDAEGGEYARDTAQRIMVFLARRWVHRIARMNGIVASDETDFPFLTCDNPAVTWKKIGEGFQCGVNQRDPSLIVSCPLAPDLMFTSYQTPESLRAVLAERHDMDQPPQKFGTHIDTGTLPVPEVKRLNLICIANAHRYLYSNYSDKRLRRFLTNNFFGKPGPARRIIDQ